MLDEVKRRLLRARHGRLPRWQLQAGKQHDGPADTRMDGERCGVETVLEDEKRHSCYLKVFFYEGARAGTARKDWSRGRELNPRPTDYESVALPLSYPGVPTFRALTSRTEPSLPLCADLCAEAARTSPALPPPRALDRGRSSSLPWALNGSRDRLPRAPHLGMMSTNQSSSLTDGGAHYGEPAEDSDYPCP